MASQCAFQAKPTTVIDGPLRIGQLAFGLVQEQVAVSKGAETKSLTLPFGLIRRRCSLSDNLLSVSN